MPVLLFMIPFLTDGAHLLLLDAGAVRLSGQMSEASAQHSDTTSHLLSLNAEAEFYNVGPHLSVLIDPDARWSFEDVMSDSLSERFEPPSSTGRSADYGYSGAVFWLRFSLRMEADREWLLEVGEKSLDYVTFHTSLAGYQPLTAGDAVPFRARPVLQRRLLFPLPQEPRYDIYLRAHSLGPISFPLRIWSEDALVARTRREEFTLGIFFGILGFMVLYNLVLYGSLRDASYLLFALFIASFAFYQASVERITFEYLWPDNLWWMERSNSLLAVFCAAWAILFTRSFLDTRRYAYVLDRVLVGLVLLCVPLAAYIAFGPRRMVNPVVVYFFIAVTPVLLCSAIVCAIHRDRAATFYLLGWTILLIGVAAGMFGYLGVVSGHFSGIDTVRYGAFTGIVLLSQIGLGYRHDQLRREREALRMRIATDLHDEIGSGLTQISLYSELIHRESNGTVAEWADEMGHHARAMTGKMQDIVWAINPGDEGWRGLELRMRDFSSQLLAPCSIAFDMQGDILYTHDPLPLEIRKNLLLIFKEIVHNAVRHAQCSHLSVRYRLTRRSVWMQICDDGRGFDREAIRENNGLRNMRFRAREIGAELSLATSPGGPTCYELSLLLSTNLLNTAERPAPLR